MAVRYLLTRQDPEPVIMDPSCLCYVCLISSIHCLIVTWLVVAIETPSTERYENSTTADNSSILGTTEIYLISPATHVEQVTARVKEVKPTTPDTKQDFVTLASENATILSGQTPTVKSILDFMPACPPPNNLHLLCNVSLGNVSCSERAIVLKSCYHRFTIIYSNSSWDDCMNLCDDIVDFLVKETLISEDSRKDVTPTTESGKYYSVEITTQSEDTSKQEVAQNTLDIVTEVSKPDSRNTTSVKHSKVEETTLGTQSSEMASTPQISDSDSVVPVSPVSKESNSDDMFPSHPLSWLYPLIGCLFILLEIIILWYFFWYRRKKYGSTPASRYRRASTGSMVIQEELIEPESTSPTKALFVNKEYNEDSATKEDEKIFNSYLNLRFIDDTSVENTPERIIRK